MCGEGRIPPPVTLLCCKSRLAVVGVHGKAGNLPMLSKEDLLKTARTILVRDSLHPRGGERLYGTAATIILLAVSTRNLFPEAVFG